MKMKIFFSGSPKNEKYLRFRFATIHETRPDVKIKFFVQN